MKRLIALLLTAVLLLGLVPMAAAETIYVYDDCVLYTKGTQGITITGFLDTIPAELTIPAKIDGVAVKAIGRHAFEYCTQLKTIHLPEGLLWINEFAFRNSGISGFLEIPSTVQTMTQDSIANTPLTGIHYLGKPITKGQDMDLRIIIMPDEWYESKNYSMSTSGGDRILLSESDALPDILSGHFTVVDGIQYLVCDRYSYLLRGVDQSSVIIPAAVEGKPLRWIMDNAFERCLQLQSVSLPEGLERIRRSAFHTTGLTALELPTSCTCLDEFAFYCTQSLKTVDLTHVHSLGNSAFKNSGLETVTLGDELTELGGYEFCGAQLQRVDVPACVPKLDGSFYDCKALTELILHEGLTELQSAVSGCTALTSLTLPSTVTEVERVVNDTGVRTLELPGAIRTLHAYAFGSAKLDSLTLNEGLETIEPGAFWGLSGLTELRLPASVTLVQHVPEIKNLCIYFHSGTTFDLDDETEPSIRYINVDTGEEVPMNLRVEEDGYTFMIRVDHAELLSVNRQDDVLTIPDTLRGFPVTVIEKGAITGLPCNELILPGTVELIRPGAITGCKNLFGLALPESLSAVEDEDGHVWPIASSAFETYFTYIAKAGSYGESYVNQLLDQIAEPDEDVIFDQVLVYEDENPYLAYGNHIFKLENGEATLLYALRRDDTRNIDRVPGYVKGIPVVAVADEAYQRAAGRMSGCRFTSIVFNPPLERIGDRLFRDDQPMHIYLPETVTEIADTAFSAKPDYIHGSTGSYAETYAAAHGDIFEDMDLPFLDVPGEKWFYKPIRYCYKAGYMNGVSADSFAPYDTVTRAMMVQVLYKIAGGSMSTGMSDSYVPPFEDVDSGRWYYNAIRWAAYYRIVAGTSATTFSPMDNCTREQVAAVLYRFGRGAGLDHGERADLSGYSDEADISAYARDALRWAVAVGMISGYTDGTVQPKGTTTRAELATMIMHFAELLYADN